jgi:hypothetical protein
VRAIRPRGGARSQYLSARDSSAACEGCVVTAVRLAPGESVQPGEYTVRDGAAVSRAVVADRCPYCDDAMLEYTTAGALRVAVVNEQPANGVQHVGAHAMPEGLRLLKCQACEQFFSAEAA